VAITTWVGLGQRRATAGIFETASISLVLADRHPITLEGLEHLFRGEGFEVLARCTGGEETLQAVRQHRPDILLLDPRLPGKDGRVVVRELRRDHVGTRIVLFTSHDDEPAFADLVGHGVHGIALKEMPSRLLVRCVRKVHDEGGSGAGEPAGGRPRGRLAPPEAAARRAAAALTDREREIVRLVAAGLCNRAIAERLDVAEGTIKMHLHNIYRKLGVSGRMALVLDAQGEGLV
jgi:two-component system nitrate/nitrite response regulator NarL